MKTSTSVELLGDEALEGAAECLRTLAHPHRLRMVQMLLQAEFTVGELAAACS
ncbi:MAG: transcriptional regulator, partial [Planctomycetota bacterium]